MGFLAISPSCPRIHFAAITGPSDGMVSTWDDAHKNDQIFGTFSMDFVTQLLKWQYRGHSINNPNNAQPKKGNPFDFPQPGNLMTPKQYGNLQKFKLRFGLPYMPKHDQKKQIFAENKALQMSERLHWDFFSAHCYWSKMQYAHRKTLNLSGVW